MEKLNIEDFKGELQDGAKAALVNKVNEVIDRVGELTTAAANSETEGRKLKEDFGVACEKIGKLEGENDALRGRLDKLEKATIALVERLAHHTHTPDGRAAIPLTT